ALATRDVRGRTRVVAGEPEDEIDLVPPRRDAAEEREGRLATFVPELRARGVLDDHGGLRASSECSHVLHGKLSRSGYPDRGNAIPHARWVSTGRRRFFGEFRPILRGRMPRCRALTGELAAS